MYQHHHQQCGHGMTTAHSPSFSPEFFSTLVSLPISFSSSMQSSHGPPPHRSMPSPTNHSNTYTTVPGSFHTSKSVPSSSHFFAMNPLTDQHLTGPPSMMPYHPLTQYVYVCALLL